jgi:hypothetical protein
MKAREKAAPVLALSAAEVTAATDDVENLPDGPAKDLLTKVALFATDDYDPGDVIVLVVRPPAYSGGAAVR